MTDLHTRNKNIIMTLDTRAKLKTHQQNKIRDYYSRIFKNENHSLVKQGIAIRSSVGSLSKTRKKQGFKVPAGKITLKTVAETIITKPVSADTVHIEL